MKCLTLPLIAILLLLPNYSYAENTLKNHYSVSLTVVGDVEAKIKVNNDIIATEKFTSDSSGTTISLPLPIKPGLQKLVIDMKSDNPSGSEVTYSLDVYKVPIGGDLFADGINLSENSSFKTETFSTRNLTINILAE